MRALVEGGEVIQALRDRVLGRVTATDVVNPDDGEVVIAAGTLIDEDCCDLIEKLAIDMVKVRSVLTCEARRGVCAKCYGRDLGRGSIVNAGESVGVIAAQSIGEPGTQLTMRTFHTGGVASAEDITQGLPRVSELFESRKPKHLAIIAEIGGTIGFEEVKKNRHIVVRGDGDQRSYLIPFGARLSVKEGDVVEKGTRLTEGSVNPHDVLAISGPEAVQDYLIEEVQRTYRMQGVDINDKHIEVIVRQMMRKVRIEDAGDTPLLVGALVDKNDTLLENEKIAARIANGETGLREATFTPTLLGITKASLATESFLSAASFQETTRVLTDAAIKGKVDPLLGLKENVIIGKLIPAGTGMDCYTNVEIAPTAPSSSLSQEAVAALNSFEEKTSAQNAEEGLTNE